MYLPFFLSKRLDNKNNRNSLTIFVINFSKIGILISIFIIFITLSIRTGYNDNLYKKIFSCIPHINIQERLNNENITFIKKRLETVSEIKNIKPYILKKCILKNKNNKFQYIYLKGISFINNPVIDHIKFIKKNNKIEFKKNQLNVVLGSNIVKSLNWKQGNDVDLIFLNKKNFYSDHNIDFIKINIIGILHTDTSMDQNYIITPIKNMQLILNILNNYDGLELQLNKPLKADAKINIIKKKIFPFTHIFNWKDIFSELFYDIRIIEIMIQFSICLILLLTFLLITGSTFIKITEKYREIAILKTLGVENNLIQKTFFLFSINNIIFPGVIGLVIGVFFVVILKYYIKNFFQINYYNHNIELNNYYLLVKFSWNNVIFTFILLISVFLLSIIYPLYKVKNFYPKKILVIS
ncbi:FtsX-like permease family protein [Buchnera aphidicola (Kurisakia onigurumii)]|uniref:ABC transporter permease n=1 Tax=Buchnera aphidicola TaxID=9 RepID=UPI0031B6CE27